MPEQDREGQRPQPRAVILAAGRGSRLGKLTEGRPKVLLEVAGRTILEHQVSALRAVGVDGIHVVAGHASNSLEQAAATLGLGVFHNRRYATTNMVATLMCAADLLDGTTDLIVAYGDIVYECPVLEALIGADGHVDVVIDHAWESYWSARMEDPLEDAETLQLDDEGRILEIGARAASISEIDGQYIGLIRVRADRQRALVAEWGRLVRGGAPNQAGRTWDLAYMTDLIRHLIDRGWDVREAPIRHGWLEFDQPADLHLVDAGFWVPERR